MNERKEEGEKERKRAAIVNEMRDGIVSVQAAWHGGGRRRRPLLAQVTQVVSNFIICGRCSAPRLLSLPGEMRLRHKESGRVGGFEGDEAWNLISFLWRKRSIRKVNFIKDQGTIKACGFYLGLIITTRRKNATLQNAFV
jgi:hypothetical protein